MELPTIHGVGPALYLELPAIIVGGLSGGVHAVQKNFDAVGVVVLAIATGLGGGLMRDVILSVGPPLVLLNPRYLYAVTAAALVAFFFAPLFSHIKKVTDFIDALSLGFFGIAGAERALSLGIPEPGALMLGVITAVGGSVARDVLANDTPELLQPGSLYATPVLFGVAGYIVLEHVGIFHGVVAAFLSIGAICGVRLVALWRDWRAPRPRRPRRA
ncbi:hypothetical protein AKJ09_07674 [Labilithrix luteola]|uniref:Glycine transporter domain-containing protein n=1 Tax=Labilithrix luteola TaxID=1391654 RepID=A0A0K1Q5A1_9BACT|nr:TRIC cation channel family protein [Labilithrix luteola]AKV01011.1 hypothetical protein AKJ09_07674 [Labilithrix luteola]